jgi:hypothetical protein
MASQISWLIRTQVNALAFLVFAGVLACQSEKESDAIMPDSDVNTVMEAHVDRLMAIPGVVGVAVGETEDKTPCILVLVAEKTEDIERELPETLEGHPVSILETGEIKPMQGD